MKEIAKQNCTTLDRGMNECCNIAESMIEEIHQIVIPKSDSVPHSDRKYKGSLKKKLLRQIRQARKIATIG
jgi:hypothetical protein